MRFDRRLAISLLPVFMAACSGGTGSGNGGNGTGSTGNGGSANGTGKGGSANGTGNGGSANGTGNGGSANGTGNGGSANGTGNGGSANGTGNGGAGGACTSFNAGANAVPPVLLFLVDTSLSMDNAPTGSTTSKWSQARTAMINALAGFPDDWAVGLTYFPHTGTGTNCYDGRMEVPIAPLCTNRTALSTSLNGTNPNGGTPTPLAMNFALSNVTRPASAAACPADYSTSPLYVVLMTDGTPTYNLQCQGIRPITLAEYNAMITAVTNAAGASAPVGTFVVGVPGSDSCDPGGGDCCTGNGCGTNTYTPRGGLSKLATAGGTATLLHPNGCSDTGPTYCHIDLSASGANFGTDLQNALGQIGGAVASCTYTTPTAPTGYVLLPNDVHVNYNGTELQHQANAPAACTSGWQYSADQSQILLCGSTCSTVKADKAASIRVWSTCLQPG